jgi:hypothetical protein
VAVKTHYDNLKVARDASDDAIRAAYWSLTEKYNPSRHPGSAEAVRITRILDEAFATLIDPVRRKKHDAWIANEERRERSASSPSLVSRITRRAKTWWSWSIAAGHREYVGAGLLLLVGVLLYFWTELHPPSMVINSAALTGQAYNGSTDASLASSASYRTVQSHYQRPALTETGHAWPTVASYLDGFPQLNTEGTCLLLVDARQNESDVEAKLVSMDGSSATPVRTFYIPAHGQFAVTQLSPGHYDVRFRDLTTGILTRTDQFTFKVHSEDGNMQCVAIALTVYQKFGGNMKWFPLNEKEF